MVDVAASAPLPETTQNRLLGGRVLLEQPRIGYRAAIDPVLLAAATPARPGERALDLGCGAGAAMLCLAARTPGVKAHGVEIQSPLVALARANIAANAFASCLSAEPGDIAALPARLHGAFDQVLMNPPFLPAGAGTVSPDPSRARAHSEEDADLAAWIAAARRALRPGGWLTMIHRADRFDEATAALSRGFGAITLIPLWPQAGRPARRAILRARKGAASPATLHPGLILHQGAGYTPQAEAILRDAQPLP